MRRILAFLWLFICLFSCVPTPSYAEPELSHSRFEDEDWRDALARMGGEAASEEFLGWGLFSRKKTPEAVMAPWEELDLTKVPEWRSLEEITEVFERIRDERYLETKSNDGFPRRISWLYPDDGCYARAAMVRQLVEDRWGHAIAKLFIFGNLTLATPNHPSGKVSWGWHVAAAARIGNAVYVLDPSVDPFRPLTASEWTVRLNKKPERTRFAICSSYAYSVRSECLEPQPDEEAKSLKDQQKFLDEEWRRLKWLKRDPEKELGASPPWAVTP